MHVIYSTQLISIVIYRLDVRGDELRCHRGALIQLNVLDSIRFD